MHCLYLALAPGTLPTKYHSNAYTMTHASPIREGIANETNSSVKTTGVADEYSIDVFVSYARRDIEFVTKFVQVLRSVGLRVWMDSAIPLGAEWRAAIVDALHQSRLMLLVHSREAERSGEVAKELAVAASRRMLIVPVRVQNVIPTGAMLYEMARLNWVDCIPQTEERMQTIAIALSELLQSDLDAAAIRGFSAALGTRGFTVSLLRRLADNVAALAAAVVVNSLLLAGAYEHSIGYLAKQADAGILFFDSLWRLLAAITLGSPVLLVNALARLSQPGAPVLAVLAGLNVVFLLLLARSLLRRALLRWSIWRASRRHMGAGL